jgi:hypothetical protein
MPDPVSLLCLMPRELQAQSVQIVDEAGTLPRRVHFAQLHPTSLLASDFPVHMLRM